MRLFITGGTGFLGSHFISMAAKAGHEIVAIRRPTSEPAISLEHHPDWLVRDLKDISASDLERCDALIHFASHGVSPQRTDWQTATEVNVWQSTKLVETACSAGIPKILLCGSCYEYGISGDQYQFIPANAPLRPVGAYAASKAAFSSIAGSMAATHESEFVLLRPFHFYGEGQHEDNFWPSLRKAALSGEDFEMTAGEQIRDFQPVSETAQSFLRTLHEWPGRRGQMHVANLGSGTPVSLADFAIRQWKHLGARGELKLGALSYRQGEIMRYVPAIES